MRRRRASSQRSTSKRSGTRAPGGRDALRRTAEARDGIADGRRRTGAARPRRCRGRARAPGRLPVRARDPPQAARERRARRRCAGRHDRPTMGRGVRAACRAMACASICRRRGGTFARRCARGRAIPQTTIILNHTGLPADRSAPRHRRMEARAGGARCMPECGGEDLRARRSGRAVDGGGEPGDRPDDDRALRHWASDVREQLSGRRAVRVPSTRSTPASARSWRISRRTSSARSSGTTRCASTAWSDS